MWTKTRLQSCIRTFSRWARARASLSNTPVRSSRHTLRSSDMSNHDGVPTQPTRPKGIDPKTDKPCEPVEIPVPKRSTWDRLLHRAEKASPSNETGPYVTVERYLDEKARKLDQAFRERPPTDY